jgi:hypothetical protein
MYCRLQGYPSPLLVSNSLHPPDTSETLLGQFQEWHKGGCAARSLGSIIPSTAHHCRPTPTTP